MKKFNIVVVGLGYVGLSNAALLAQDNNVLAIDVDEEKLKLIAKKQSPLHDDLISDYLRMMSLMMLCTRFLLEIYFTPAKLIK